jgi:flavoprotein
MANIPDHIDKNDKKAVAAYFIHQRFLKENKDFYDQIIEREGKGYTFAYGQPSMEVFDFLRTFGYTVENVAHITWKIAKPLDK